MSVLSFPRIYFYGCMCWDPATGNNNDYFPTYDDTNAILNWPFLNGQGITPSNFGATFRDWAINLQTIPPYNGGQPGIPGEWNYFGGNGAYFLQYVDPTRDIDRRTMISGGKLGPTQIAGSDAFFQKIATLLDCFASQRGHQWFTAETFAAILRLRGIGCNAPSGMAEAFYCRKAVV